MIRLLLRWVGNFGLDSSPADYHRVQKEQGESEVYDEPPEKP